MTPALHIAHDRGGLGLEAASRAAADCLLSDLEALGVDYGDVTDKLESDGLAAFDASWRELGDQLRTALRRRPNGKESGE